MVFVTSFISGCKKTLVVRPELFRNAPCSQHGHSETAVTCQDILDTIFQKEGCCSHICLSHEGRVVQLDDDFRGDVNIVATLKLRGGKGGFGSMLRAIGAQIEKTTNREACRDLSGRRLRDINEEKRLKEYLSKKVEKEVDMFNKKRKKLEQLKDGPKHIFEDKAYFEQREKREQDIHDSLDKAFTTQPGSSKLKTSGKNGKPQNPLKRKRMIDDLDESSSEESDCEVSPQQPSQEAGKDEKTSALDTTSNQEKETQQHDSAESEDDEVEQRRNKQLRIC